MNAIEEIIEMLEEMKIMTGRMGRYELDTTEAIILKLKNIELYSRSDMELSFFKGSRILSDNNSLDHTSEYQKFMQEDFNVKL